MHNANAPENTSMLTSCKPGDAGYLSTSDRFHTDVAGEEMHMRNQNIERRKKIDDFKRNVVCLFSDYLDCFLSVSAM